MDIARLLMPRYVLMENVVDILKFGDGILGRYAIRRLVNMGYQVPFFSCCNYSTFVMFSVGTVIDAGRPAVYMSRTTLLLV